MHPPYLGETLNYCKCNCRPTIVDMLGPQRISCIPIPYIFIVLKRYVRMLIAVCSIGLVFCRIASLCRLPS